MTNWFAYLNFKSVSELTRCTFMELDKYADYTFDNGIWIRVVVGKYADTTPSKPYEIMMRKPHCSFKSIPNLSRKELILKMEEINQIIIFE